MIKDSEEALLFLEQFGSYEIEAVTLNDATPIPSVFYHSQQQLVGNGGLEVTDVIPSVGELAHKLLWCTGNDISQKFSKRNPSQCIINV